VCGIAGIITKDSPTLGNDLINMLSELIHRGKDATGVAIYENRDTIDLRVGGTYRHVMQITGAGECTVEGKITELDPPARFAYVVPGAPAAHGMPPLPETTTTVELVEQAGGTLLTMTITGLASTPFEDIVSGGWQAGFEKLAASLPESTSQVG